MAGSKLSSSQKKTSRGRQFPLLQHPAVPTPAIASPSEGTGPAAPPLPPRGRASPPPRHAGGRRAPLREHGTGRAAPNRRSEMPREPAFPWERAGEGGAGPAPLGTSRAGQQVARKDAAPPAASGPTVPSALPTARSPAPKRGWWRRVKDGWARPAPGDLDKGDPSRRPGGGTEGWRRRLRERGCGLLRASVVRERRETVPAGKEEGGTAAAFPSSSVRGRFLGGVLAQLRRHAKHPPRREVPRWLDVPRHRQTFVSAPAGRWRKIASTQPKPWRAACLLFSGNT